jgi:hypothetical protein
MYRTSSISPLLVFTAWELLSWTLVLSRGVCLEAGWLIKMGGLSLVGALEGAQEYRTAKIILVRSRYQPGTWIRDTSGLPSYTVTRNTNEDACDLLDIMG